MGTDPSRYSRPKGTGRHCYYFMLCADVEIKQEPFSIG
jgi:hypothetical protein